MAEYKLNEAEHIAHACIISASAAEDSLREARKMAKALVCTAEGDRPCGLCRSCRKAENGIHPDIITLGRLADDKGKTKREINIEQIRQIRSDACVLPNEAKQKVYIINEADSMNVPAQNAALKLLEEPPNGAVFLLCVRNAQQLLSTVRSRCSEITLGGGNKAEEDEQQKLALEYIKTLAEGRRTKLLRWCSQNEGMDTRDAAEFIDAASDILADMLCGRRPDLGIGERELVRLSQLTARCGKYLKVNVGVKHIFGLLAVDSIAAAEKEEI